MEDDGFTIPILEETREVCRKNNKKKKLFAIEYKVKNKKRSPLLYRFLGDEWHTYKKYKTERDRDNAMIGLNRGTRSNMYEFRKAKSND